MMAIGPSRQATQGFIRKFSKVFTKNEVLQLHVFHRHGDRTPFTRLINEEFWQKLLPINEVEWLNTNNTLIGLEDGLKIREDPPFGSLTKRGVNQLVDVGKYLNNKYPGRFEDSIIWCTHFRRTIQSVQSLIKGLEIQSHKNIDISHYKDLLPDAGLNDRAKILVRNFFDSDEIVDFFKKHNDLYSQVAFDLWDLGLITRETKLNWNRLHEITHCLLEYDILPEERITPEMCHQIQDINRYIWFSRLSHNHELLHLHLGPILKHILKSKEKTNIYSCHDTTLISLMCGLGLDPIWPPYASCLEIAFMSDDTVEATFNRSPIKFLPFDDHKISIKNLEKQIHEGVTFEDPYSSIYRFKNI